MDEVGNSCYQTVDGGFIAVGSTTSYGQGTWDIFLVKTDCNGMTQWEKDFGGSAIDYGTCVEEISDGGYIISGLTYSSGNGMGDVILIRTDANGDQIWQQIYGGDNQDGAYFVTHTQNEDGYLAFGWTLSYGAGNQDMWLIQTDLEGNKLWDKTIGGSNYDCGVYLSLTNDGGYICTGRTSSFGQGDYDIWMVKLGTDDRNIPWDVKIGIEAGTYSDLDNIAGTSFSATDTFDIGIDVPEPPLPTQDYVQLYFPHPEWNQTFTNYSADIRYPVSLLYYQLAYSFCIATDQPHQYHKITVAPQSGINYTDGLYIRDVTSGQMVKLTSDQNTYTFTPDTAGIYDFTLLAGRLYPLQSYQTEFPAGWSMVSLSLSPINNSVSAIFGDDLDQPGYFYEYLGNHGFKPAKFLEQGRGYWLGLLEDQMLDYEGDSLDAILTVNLSTGNNLIGNPFRYQIDKSNLTFTHNDSTLTFDEAVAKGWLSPAIHHWDNQGAGAYMNTDNLGLGWGAWMYVLVDSVKMHFQPGESNGLPKAAEVVSDNDWNMHLALTSAWGLDNTNLLGVRDLASDGFDASLDYPEPPSAPSGQILSGYFEHADWSILGPKYDHDIRAISDEETCWEFTVYSSVQGNVNLSWEFTNVPTTLSLVLFDPLTETRIDMNKSDNYTFNYQTKRVFEVIKGTKSDLNLITITPTEYKLSQNFPNPFNPVTTVEYQLPRSEDVNIAVFNLRGEKVKEIVDKRQAAGYYSVQVDFSDLSSGIYLYRLKAGNYIAFRKCMVVK